MTLRKTLYRSASLLGDLHAAEKGRLPQRLVRKVVYRHAFSFTRWLLRKVGL
jgi:hypothetical protein